MEYKQIEELLEKYMEAETSLQEEESLKDYFSQEEIPPHLEEYRSMFAYFAISGNETLQPPAPQKRTNNFSWMKVAAAVVMALGTYGIYNSEQHKKAAQEAQAREAYVQTREALDLISESLNKGTNKLAYISQFEVTKNKIIKN